MRSSPLARVTLLAIVLVDLTIASLGAVPSAPGNLVAQVVGNTVSLTAWARQHDYRQAGVPSVAAGLSV